MPLPLVDAFGSPPKNEEAILDHDDHRSLPGARAPSMDVFLEFAALLEALLVLSCCLVRPALGDGPRSPNKGVLVDELVEVAATLAGSESSPR